MSITLSRGNKHERYIYLFILSWATRLDEIYIYLFVQKDF